MRSIWDLNLQLNVVISFGGDISVLFCFTPFAKTYAVTSDSSVGAVYFYNQLYMSYSAQTHVNVH